MHYIELTPRPGEWSLTHNPDELPWDTEDCPVTVTAKASDPPLVADENSVYECWEEGGVFVLGPEVGYQMNAPGPS